MIVCLDVHYRDPGALAAGLWFQLWTDSTSSAQVVLHIERVEPYQSGQFYRRELPCLLSVLAGVGERPEAVVVDGYAWLRDQGAPGLGAHLYEALGRAVPVVGVAKSRFAGAAAAREVLRGASRRPLFVTAAGMDADEAARHVLGMHGPYRIPTALRRVDQLCRTS